MLKLKYCLSIAMFLAIVLSSATDDFNKRGEQTADQIPAIITSLIDGTPFTADTLKGKMIVINFWENKLLFNSQRVVSTTIKGLW